MIDAVLSGSRTWSIERGDVLEVLRRIPNESIQSVVTSPPYWGLRDYGVAGQIGVETTLAEYIEKMVATFREVRRVLRSDGTLWLNLGDCYNGARGGEQGATGQMGGDRSEAAERCRARGVTRQVPGLKPKDLIGVPWRVAFALQTDGWWLRTDVIWHKPNPMPNPVDDRPTNSHEYVFLLTKSEDYFYDTDAIREPAKRKRSGNKQRDIAAGAEGDRPADHLGRGVPWVDDGRGRNARSVWTITTKRFEEAHFATFPPELPERCILAGTSERGACATCGVPWERIVEVTYENPGNRTTNGPRSLAQRHESPGFKVRLEKRVKTIGWGSACKCGTTETVPCVVLDPFAGAGTTILVARRLHRRALGIELKPEYAEMAERRIGVDQPLFNREGGSA